MRQKLLSLTAGFAVPMSIVSSGFRILDFPLAGIGRWSWWLCGREGLVTGCMSTLRQASFWAASFLTSCPATAPVLHVPHSSGTCAVLPATGQNHSCIEGELFSTDHEVTAHTTLVLQHSIMIFPGKRWDCMLFTSLVNFSPVSLQAYHKAVSLYSGPTSTSSSSGSTNGAGGGASSKTAPCGQPAKSFSSGGLQGSLENPRHLWQREREAAHFCRVQIGILSLMQAEAAQVSASVPNPKGLPVLEEPDVHELGPYESASMMCFKPMPPYLLTLRFLTSNCTDCAIPCVLSLGIVLGNVPPCQVCGVLQGRLE